MVDGVYLGDGFLYKHLHYVGDPNYIVYNFGSKEAGKEDFYSVPRCHRGNDKDAVAPIRTSGHEYEVIDKIAHALEEETEVKKKKIVPSKEFSIIKNKDGM